MSKPLGHEGLPPKAYTDPEFLEKECAALLLTSWQWAGLIDGLQQPAGIQTEVAGVPIAIQGNPKNMTVVLDAGRRRKVLAGATAGACGRFVFVRMKGEGASLADYLGDYAAVLRHCSDDFDEAYHGAKEDWDCNWKAGLEVTLEGYHVAMVHSGSNFSDAVPDSQLPTYNGPHSYQCGLMSEQMRTEMASIAKRLKIKPSNKFSNYDHFTLFPNMTIGISGGCLCFMQIYTPLSPSRTRLRYAYILAKAADSSVTPAAPIKGALLNKWRDYTRLVLGEDQLACERFQRGVRFAKHPAVIGASVEQRILHFHKFWRQAMNQDNYQRRKSA